MIHTRTLKVIPFLISSIILLFFSGINMVFAATDIESYIAENPGALPDWLTPELYNQVSDDIWIVNTVPDWDNLLFNLGDIMSVFNISSADEFVAVYDIINTSPWANNWVFVEIAHLGDIDSVAEFEQLNDIMPIGTNLGLVRKIFYYADPPVNTVDEFQAFIDDGRDVACELQASQSSFEDLSDCPGHEDDPEPEPEDPDDPDNPDDEDSTDTGISDEEVLELLPRPPPEDGEGRPSDVFGLFFLYLPVNDEELNAQFFEYHVDFNAFTVVFNDYREDFYNYWWDMLDMIEQDTDSLKNLLGGVNPGGVASVECAEELVDAYELPYNPGLHFMYNHPFSPVGPLLNPDDYDNKFVAENPGRFVRVHELVDINVNSSGSLRCLLQELVEWQKLDLNLTVHAMMKEFIQDSQSFLFAKQMQTFIVAGLMDHSRFGVVQQLAMDKEVAASTYAANPEHELHKRNSSVRQGMVSQIQGNDDGFETLNIFDPFRVGIAHSIATNNLKG